MADSVGSDRVQKTQEKSQKNPKVKNNEKLNDAAGSSVGSTHKSKAQLKAERRAKQEAANKEGQPQTAVNKGQNTTQDLKQKIAQNKGKENAGSDQASAGSDASKSKAQLKAERRAKQEAQRAAKASQKAGPDQPTGQQTKGKPEGAPKNAPTTTAVKAPKAANSSAKEIQDGKKLAKRPTRKPDHIHKKVVLFKHLYRDDNDLSFTHELSFGQEDIHPATLKLGLQYAKGLICGSNSRCLALLAVVKQIVKDYSLPADKEISRDLVARLQPDIDFLHRCRQLSVSMANALKFIKLHITNTPSNLSETQAKEKIMDEIDNFYQERIFDAGNRISEHALSKIVDGDVILVYACSSLIRQVLLDAHKKRINFRVIVIDSRPKYEGREMLKRLVANGIRCSYGLINAVSYVMPEVTKVLLGAHALLANGYVMSRVGSCQVAVLAKAYNKPVLVCCETYKFSERVQTDAFVFNELGDPEVMIDVGRDPAPLTAWREKHSLRLLNLLYDVTPSDLVTSVITELGYLPCTSVPVVLRVHQERNEAQQQAVMHGEKSVY